MSLSKSVPTRRPRKIAVFVPSLGHQSPQDDDVLQMLFIAASLLVDADQTTVTLIAVDRDLSGWEQQIPLFPKDVIEHIEVAELPVATPHIEGAVGAQEFAYYAYEYLSKNQYHEAHALDLNGLLNYAAGARRLGVAVLDTELVVHVIGGAVFRHAAQDRLVDSWEPMIADVLEQGSLLNADTIFVHDPRAWQWWIETAGVEAKGKIIVADISSDGLANNSRFGGTRSRGVAYYGTLSVEGGLPLFCDAMDRLEREGATPSEIHVVGASGPISGRDGLSYTRIRSAKWGASLAIHRDLSVLDELKLLGQLGFPIYASNSRRESFRARCLRLTQLPVVWVGTGLGACEPQPGTIAKALLSAGEAGDGHAKHIDVSKMISAWQKDVPEIMQRPPAPSPSPLRLLTTSEQPSITVCIAHHERPSQLRRALRSLQNQKYENFDVVVVDDGSYSPDVLHELDGIADEMIELGWTLLRQENRYLGAARNAAARHSSADYLLFMDDDNVAKPDELPRMAAVAVRTGADIITAFFDIFWSEGHLSGEEPIPYMFGPLGADATLGSVTNCYGDANALCSREIFDRVGGFSEDFGITHEDWEFLGRAHLIGADIVCVPERLFLYYLDREGMLRGTTGSLRRESDLFRHLRPFIEHLPYDLAKIQLFMQGMHGRNNDVASVVGYATRSARVRLRPADAAQLPFGRTAVITRTKDRPILLARAIRSVLSQTFHDWLLVIVNDGGVPLDVDAVVSQYRAELGDRVLVLHNPVPTGMQAASNTGIANCRSEYIVIHDDDDSWESDFLAKTVSFMDDHGWNPSIGGVVTRSNLVLEDISSDGTVTITDTRVFNENLDIVSLRTMAVENSLPPISFLFARAALDDVQPFDERLTVLGDWEFYLRMLEKYEICVIAEALANYHHRSVDTSGVYGNSVHAQNDVHRIERAQLINRALRVQLANGESIADLLVLGEVQQALVANQVHEAQKIKEYLWSIEQKLSGQLSWIAGKIPLTDGLPVNVQETPDSRPSNCHDSRNMLFNGDFRFWPADAPARNIPAFSEIGPGVYVSYDSPKRKFVIERRIWNGASGLTRHGQTYLHVKSPGSRHTPGTYFLLEFVIPSALTLAGRTVCVSGLSRMPMGTSTITIGGYHTPGDGTRINLPATEIVIEPHWDRWHCVYQYPQLSPEDVEEGHHHRIFLALPTNREFVFDLTELQVESGSVPTAFEYRGSWRPML